MQLKKILLLVFFTNLILSASTSFTLTGINKLYLVVEISGKTVPKTYKKMMLESLQSVTDDLKINTTGYDPRCLAVLINETKINESTMINIRLIIGEQVKRLDNNETTFALTYQSMDHFLFQEGDDLEDKLEDTFDTMLLKFSEQYQEENKKISKVQIDEQNFASEMGYETNYNEALKKAQKLKKNVMLVLVSNFCPWCRKFEQRVLLKNEVNKIIQKNYVPVILNKERDPFPKEFDTGFTPIIHFIDYKTQKSYHHVIGYNNKDEFTYLLRSDDSTK